MHCLCQLVSWEQALPGMIASLPKFLEEPTTMTDLRTLTPKQANAGDSRGVLGIKGRAKPLSQDHKPQLDSWFPLPATTPTSGP